MEGNYCVFWYESYASFIEQTICHPLNTMILIYIKAVLLFLPSGNHCDLTLGRESLFQNGMQKNPGEIQHLLWEQKWRCSPVAKWVTSMLSTGQGVKLRKDAMLCGHETWELA